VAQIEILLDNLIKKLLAERALKHTASDQANALAVAAREKITKMREMYKLMKLAYEKKKAELKLAESQKLKARDDLLRSKADSAAKDKIYKNTLAADEAVDKNIDAQIEIIKKIKQYVLDMTTKQ